MPATAMLRRPNSTYRSREHLTSTEIEQLITASKANRHGHRDSTMVLTAYRHGLRASELVDLRWGPGRFRQRYHARPPGQEEPCEPPRRVDFKYCARLQRKPR
jgi:integrase